MNNKSLIIYDNNSLYEILNEIGDHFNFSVIKFDKTQFLKFDIENNSNFIIITKKAILNKKNQIILNKFPINIFKLIEKLNIEFLKLKFNQQSQIKINKYIFDLNSREMVFKSQILKLTEKEINSIIYLYKARKPVRVEELQINVWGYTSDLETHTVETHIYRLRKKILEVFKDKKFINSVSNGYQIEKKKKYIC